MSEETSHNGNHRSQSDPDENWPPSAPLEELADAWLAGEDDLSALPPIGAELLNDLLELLVSDPQGLIPEQLRMFSDLSRQDAVVVRQTWPLIPVDRRRSTVRYLTEVAQNDYQIALGRFLRIALADADSEVRRLAIEGLNGEYESDLIGPLIQILHNDDDAATRAAAAAALGAFILAGELEELDTALSMRVEETLLSILTQPEEAISVQCRALESIAYSGETGVRQLIEDAYYSQYEEMRISSLIAMGRSADVRWRGLARAELQNPSAAMRREAAYTCGELETSAAAEDLIGLVEDNDKDVRLAAIYALGHIGGPDAREILETVRLGDDPDEVNMADLALEELMFFSSPDGNPLMEELFDAPDERDDEPWSKNADDDLDFGSYEE